MYYNKKIEEIEKDLETSEQGLTKKEALARQKRYGKNILPKKESDSLFKIFLNEFKDPMVILLLASILVSVVVGEIVDAVVILAIVLIDASMGAFQENKANHTAEALQNLVTTKAKVIRDGVITSIVAEDLTVGDYVLLESGDRIGADMRIVEAHNLMVDESILTGESTQVNKHAEVLEQEDVILSEQSNMVFSGTTVMSGRAKAIVVGVGSQTEIGKIADSINQVEEVKSPLTLRVEKLSKQITMLVLIVAVVVAILLLLHRVPYHELFLAVIALAVSAMPEGLPLALTMALTIASNKMAKKNVIIRKLNAAESLGSCTVIASDKTGTLTINEQTAKKMVLPNKKEYLISDTGLSYEGLTEKEISKLEELALLGTINNEAEFDGEEIVGDSIDIAFKILGKKLNVFESEIRVLEMLPYESENQYSAIFYEKEGETYCTIKGSLEVVKSFCKDIQLTKESIQSHRLEEQNELLAKDGYRVIALANGKVERQKKYSVKDIKNLTFMGMVGFIDPIREEAVDSIKECHLAGIKVLMITGDHPLTAYSIAKDLNLVKDYDHVTTGEEVDKEYEKGLPNFDYFIKQKIVFARVTPIQKLRIVESLKRQGEFVAVTGDGVNDAPALKAANIGIAMGSGTDIAIETADMIIADDNFKSIVSGIEEGRVAYANIRKIILFLISCGLSEVIFFCLSILLNLPMPLVAVQLLWLNVVTDGIQDFALSFEKAEKGILREKPRDPNESIFNKVLLKEILNYGTLIGMIVFVVWYLLLKVFHFELGLARTYIMTLMVFIQNIHVFNCRSEQKSAFEIPLSDNWLILFSVVFSISLQIIIMEVPFFAHFLQMESIPFLHLVLLFLISTWILFIVEIDKKRES